MITVAQLLRQGAARLRASSDSPLLDAEVLLGSTLNLNRTELHQHALAYCDANVVDFFLRLVSLRQRRIPVAYLTGRQAFMDFDLMVTPHTLIPRPFTELLIEAVLTNLANQPAVIADIGTGSGAIALAIAKHAPRSRVIATDTSVPALTTAASNARRLNLLRRVDWRIGSLLEPLHTDDNVSAIVANLPYLPTTEMSEPSIRHEPASALHGGPDGLDLINLLLQQLRRVPTINLVALELLPAQADTVGYLLRLQDFTITTVTDGHHIRGLLGKKHHPASGRGDAK